MLIEHDSEVMKSAIFTGHKANLHLMTIYVLITDRGIMCRRIMRRSTVHSRVFAAPIIMLLAWCTLPSAQTQPSQIEATSGSLQRIEIEGGYGYLTSLRLNSDGTYTWMGSEPDRRSASMKTGTLADEDVKHIWSLADKLSLNDVRNEYNGGNHTYQLVLVYQNTRRAITIKASKDDTRPPVIKELADALWKTREKL
jgi:hypothetical protein